MKVKSCYSFEDCVVTLRKQGKPLFGPQDGSMWCNATWDSILCWPATAANTTITQKCPSAVEEFVTKFCQESGTWLVGNGKSDFPQGNPCVIRDNKDCLDDGESVQAYRAKVIATIFEYTGLIISLLSLLVGISLFVFFSCRRKRIFCHHQPYFHLMIALLATVLIRLTLYINLGDLCQDFQLLLEYFNGLAVTWVVLESLYLLIRSILSSILFIGAFGFLMLGVGYVSPFVHIIAWRISAILSYRKNVEQELCDENYYFNEEYQIMLIPRWTAFAITIITILVAAVCFWFKRKRLRNESAYWKARILVALLICFVLLLPYAFQMVSRTTKRNTQDFGISSFIFAFITVYQGTIVAVLCVSVLLLKFKMAVDGEAAKQRIEAEQELLQKL